MRKKDPLLVPDLSCACRLTLPLFALQPIPLAVAEIGPSRMSLSTARPEARLPMTVPYSVAPVLSSVAGRSVWQCRQPSAVLKRKQR
jgi:hypothetical protein